MSYSLKEVQELEEALADVVDAYLAEHGCFPLDKNTDKERQAHAALSKAYEILGGAPHERRVKPRGGV